MELKISGCYPTNARREQEQWLDALKEADIDLANARERFNQATQPELIEQCVFEINALMARQAYFWRMIRENYSEGGECL
ncbi:MAG: DUF2508 domain-containing protein [Oscillospiraceae bacterium]|nr:DUF2508 domain-containing protein [Oscillospiraceae bacterium]